MFRSIRSRIAQELCLCTVEQGKVFGGIPIYTKTLIRRTVFPIIDELLSWTKEDLGATDDAYTLGYHDALRDIQSRLGGIRG